MIVSTMDIESSGLSDNSYPIEIAVYFFDGNNFIEKNWLIKTPENWLVNGSWDVTASVIHGISTIKNEECSVF